MSKRERILLRVERGALVPADAHSQQRLRERGYRVGDVLAAELAKPRSPGFWRLAHRIGTLCTQSIDAFNGLTAHQAIKKIQADAGLECDVTHTDIPGLGVLVSKQPRSLSFESMEQGQFYEFTRAACRHIASTYWPHLTTEQVQEMAESFIEEGA